MRARRYAKLTIPALVPPANNSAATKYPTPYQSIGARGVNNLASKLTLAMFPPNSGFFQLDISDFDLERAAGQQGARANIDAAFGKIERAVNTRIETKGVRVKIFEATKQLIVAGNVLLYIQNDGTLRQYPLSRYVVKRDPSGNILEIITKEDISPLALTQQVLQACGIEVKEDSPEDVIHLFTRVYKEEDGTFSFYQELNGKQVPGSEGSAPADELPWLPLRFIPVENEDYGRSYVEECYGDLNVLESLRKAMTEGAAAAARVLFLLKPNATTNKKRISEAPNGALVEGNVDDIGILKLDKYADFRTPFELAQELTKSLSFTFLLNSSVQRNGERVTAEEIRYVAEELESTLGGIYSVLSQELQLSLVKVYLLQMRKAGEVPNIPKDLVAPKITTGLSALGRGFEMSKLDQFMAKLAPLGPEVISTYINLSDYITRMGTGLALDTDGLVRSEEEVQQAQKQQQLAQAAQAAVPNAVKGMADHINNKP
ncbi:MAG: phage tail protein [Pseudomonadota bacterium]|nr:phage tail protein [Pseudomonadota bacterium]